MAIYSTDFSEYSGGLQPSDWTERWSTGTASFSVEDDATYLGGKALYLASTSDARQLLTWDSLDASDDVDIIARFSLNASGERFRLIARASGSAGSENGYHLSFYANNITLSKYNNGSPAAVGGGASLFAPAPTTLYFVRFQLIGINLKVKLWDGDSVEPPHWLIETTDSDIASGWVGVGGFGQNSKLDYISIGKDGSEPSMPEALALTAFGRCLGTSYVSGSLNDVRLQGGLFDQPKAYNLVGARIYCTGHTAQVRIAAYSGGSLSDPNGATLLCDLGLTSGSATGSIEVNCSPVQIPNGAPLWLGIKGNDSGFSFRFQNRPAHAGSFQLTRGRYGVSSGISTDETIAFPETLSVSGSYYDYWYDFQAVIEAAEETVEAYPESGSLTFSGGIPIFETFPKPASGQISFSSSIPEISAEYPPVPHLKQSGYGLILFINNCPVVKAGLYGRVRMGQPTSKGHGLYGQIYMWDPDIGFPGSELTIAELYEITCQDGSVARFTSHSENIEYGGYTWQAVPMQRGQIKMHSDLQVDKLSLDMGLIGITLGAKAYTIPQLIKRGFLRQARVKITAIDYVSKALERKRFDGYITDTIGYNSGVLSLQIGSLLDKLNETFPKLVYSEFCPHRLFGTWCGLDAATYKASGATGVDSTTKRIYADVFLFASQAEGYWVRGEIRITDIGSDDYNVSRTIIVHGDGYVDLMLPFEQNPPAGTTFDVWPGCDKTGVTCDEKFDNYANFLGFEYIPKPEVLYG